MPSPRRPDIFKIGSCRTNLEHFFPAGEFKANYKYSHTSKEAIQWINILGGNTDIHNIAYLDMVIPNKEGFDIERYRQLYRESNVLLVEISSLKMLTYGGSYYNLDYFYHESSNNPTLRDIIDISIQKADNLRDDLLEIQRLAGHKRVIFIGHLLMDFYDLPAFNPVHMKIIDEVLRKEPGSIILADLFQDADDYKDVFNGDPNHLRESSKEKIARKIKESISCAL